eukprot:CAMPEP_0177649322 /NCGR_PEP_ID=MMETSP0447-20121125/11320_1 /TAXON_ID=0 /ORGANISM="Stygamoeba regulata, Strain BSH-02190019" /LENGTH=501 /DNA_ID=CAMNT_0019152063 /DNA_START=215 /DNA_END=1720 /DNA_ORIENTATION=+
MSSSPEIGLDPPNWEHLEELGHRMVTDMFKHLRERRDDAVWREQPKESVEFFRQALPQSAQPSEQVYRDYLQHVLPYSMGNTHPRFWGWVIGTNTPMGVLADMLAAVANPNCGGGSHSAIQVEKQVIDWCADVVGYERAACSGLLVGGCSSATWHCLAIARNQAGRTRGIGEHGLAQCSTSARLIFYTSVEQHMSIERAVQLLGLGVNNLRKISVDEQYAMRVDELRAAIEQDLASGFRPACVIATLGTVNSGAVDPLPEIVSLCREFGIWLHVDGAFGALLCLAPERRHLCEGLSHADSISFDLHKWLHVGYGTAVALTRHPQAHLETFHKGASYLENEHKGLSGGFWWPGMYGLQLSRGFSALRAWMTIKHYGTERLGALIDQNCEQAAYLARLVERTPKLELIAPVPMNIVCFRFVDPSLSLSLDEWNAFNRELLLDVQLSGVAVLSGVTLQGMTGLRAAICNHRTRRSDLDLTVTTILALAERRLTEPSPEQRRAKL